MPYPVHPSRPPQIDSLLEVLERHGVRFVLAGSVATRLHGVDLEPGDLDIVPALDPANLARLVEALQVLEATNEGPPGDWHTLENGERRWVARPSDDPPDPDARDISTLDALFVTRFGNLDVVPEIAGGHDALMQRATEREVGERRVWVAHVDELLAGMTVPRRDKDVARVRALRALQRRTHRSDSG